MVFLRKILACAAAVAVCGLAVADHKGKPHGKPGDGDGAAPEIACIKINQRSNNLWWEHIVTVMDADGSNRTDLFSTGRLDLWSGVYLRDPSFSPDRQTVAFAYQSPGTENGIHVIGVDGSGQLQLTQAGDSPAWSPDGGQIAYSKAGDIWVVDADGSNDTNLTGTADTVEEFPTWSPGGGRIAFRTRAPSGARVSDVEIYDVSTGTISTVAIGGALAGQDMKGLDWAKTQDKIVLAAGDPTKPNDHDEDLWIVDLSDPANPVRLTNTAAGDDSPSWSPDDTAIVFERSNNSLYTIDGTGEAQLAARTEKGPISTSYRYPDWGR